MEDSLSGTSIQDLYRTQSNYFGNVRNLADGNQTKYNAGQNMHYEQGHNAQHQMHQAQHMPYYNSQNAPNYPQFNQEMGPNPGYLTPRQQSQEAVDIEELAKELNNNMGEDNFTVTSENMEDGNGSNQTLLGSVPEMLREPILILVLYVLLSQPMVKDTIGQYVKQINPDMDGRVSFTGVVIYGIILATLYALAKRFIL